MSKEEEIPELDFPSEWFSESETPMASGRSTTTDSLDFSAKSETLKPKECTKNVNCVLYKVNRKSIGRRSFKKGYPMVGSPSVLKPKIPRLLLTPSSSSTLKSKVSPSPTTKTNNTAELEKSVPKKKSAAVLNFRMQKSISQMDFKHARRTGNHLLPVSPLRITEVKNDCFGQLVPAGLEKLGGENLGMTTSQMSLVKMLKQDDYYYMLQDRDPKLAGMKIFSTIMLNAWRKRRDQVKHLLEEVNDLKRVSIKSKNQLHVYCSLFRVEQKRNEELNLQIKQSLEDINNSKSSCETLTTSLISLKADKTFLEQQLVIKDQEFENLNIILTQTKSDLFKAMSQQRELQGALSIAQRKVQLFDSQNKELVNEICELTKSVNQKEEESQAELAAKNEELSKTLEEIKLLEELLADFKQKDYEANDYALIEADLKNEIDILQSEVNALQTCLAATIGYRLKHCWNKSLDYKDLTLRALHWFAFYVLPGTPAPKMTSLPLTLTWDKAMKIIKR